MVMMDKDIVSRKPVKVYRAIMSPLMMGLFHLVLAAGGIYVMITESEQMTWWVIAIVLVAVVGLIYCGVTWLVHIGDRLTFYNNTLLIGRAERRVKGDKWKTVRDVEIDWRSIKKIGKSTEKVGLRSFCRWVELTIRDGSSEEKMIYRISPDFYDTFHLERKLDAARKR